MGAFILPRKELSIIEVFKLFGSILVDSDGADKSISKTGDKAEGLGSKLGKGVKTAAIWGAAIGGAAIAAGVGMFKMATSSAETTDRIDKLSQKIGMSRKGFQEMDFIASQSGMSIESLQVGFKTLRGAMEQAEKGTGKGAEAFKELGISVKDSNGNLRDQEEVFNEAVNKLQGMEDGTEKAMLATKLFGKSGQELMPLLNGAAGSMDEMRQQANDLGLVLSDDAIDAGVAFTDTMDQLKRSFEASVAELGVQFMPMITKFADFIIANMPLIQSIIGTVFGVMSTVIGVAVEWLTKIVDVVAQVVASIIDWAVQSGSSMGAVQGVFTSTIDTIVALFTGFFTLLKNMWALWGADILSVLKAAWDLIIPIFKLAFDLINDIFKVFISLFKGDWQGAWAAVGTLLDNAWKNIVVVIEKALALIEKLVTLAFTVIQTAIQVAMDFILATIKGIWEGIGIAFSSALDFISRLTGTNFDSIKNLVDKYMKLVSANITVVWNFIKSTFTNILNLIKAIVTGDFEGMWNAIKDQMDNIKKTIEDIWGNVMDFFNGIDLKQVGIDIIMGLINGISSMATAVVDSVKGVVGGAIEGAKNLLQINSPSKVFDKLGVGTGQGYIEGVLSKIGAVAKAGKKLAEAVIQPAGDYALNGLSGSNSLNGYETGSTQNDEFGKSVVVHQENHFYNLKNSPSEDARLQKRASEEALMQWVVT